MQVTVTPQNALNLETGVCDVLTPEMQVAHLEWTDGRFNIRQSNGVFPIKLISAQKQTAPEEERDLKPIVCRGKVNVDGEVFALPLTEKESSVDSSLAKLLDGYQCEVKVDYRPDATACDYINVLGAYAAHWLMEAFAEAHDQVEANEACGFSSERVVADPSMFATEGAVLLETFEWNVEACEHTFRGRQCFGRL